MRATFNIYLAPAGNGHPASSQRAPVDDTAVGPVSAQIHVRTLIAQSAASFSVRHIWTEVRIHTS